MDSMAHDGASVYILCGVCLQLTIAIVRDAKNTWNLIQMDASEARES